MPQHDNRRLIHHQKDLRHMKLFTQENLIPGARRAVALMLAAAISFATVQVLASANPTAIRMPTFKVSAAPGAAMSHGLLSRSHKSGTTVY